MRRLPLMLVLLVTLAPVALAQGAANELPTQEDVTAPPALERVGSGISEGVATATDAAASAATAVGSGVATAASAVGRFALGAARAIGEGIAFVLTLAVDAVVLLGHAIAAIGRGAWVAITFIASSLAALVSVVAAALGSGATAGLQLARDHPRETAVVAGSAAGAGTLAWLAKRLGLLGLIPLYTRLAPSQMLDNEQRARVYEHVKANPGAHPSAIAESLGLGWGTVIYHLSRLEQTKLVTVRHGSHRKCYFAVDGSLDAQERAAVAAASGDKARAIVQAIREAPGLSQKDLAGTLGMSQALASWHVKRLVASGVLVVAREGRSNTLRVAEHVPDLVAAPSAPVAVVA